MVLSPSDVVLIFLISKPIFILGVVVILAYNASPSSAPARRQLPDARHAPRGLLDP